MASVGSLRVLWRSACCWRRRCRSSRLDSTPLAPTPSDLAIRLELAGRMPTFRNPTSPAAAGLQLLLIDQSGYLYRWSEGRATELITPKTLPPGVKLIGSEPLLNVAADRAGAKVYVLFISATAPPGVPRQTSPRAPDGWYPPSSNFSSTNCLSAARPVTALQVRSEGHTGGGLTVLDDGTVLMALGDNGDSYEDGRAFAQNPANHLAKLVRVNPSTGATSIVGLGVRAAQRLAVYTFDGEPWVTFVDPGGWVAEEVNAVRVNDLIANPSRLNFGWARHPCGRQGARRHVLRQPAWQLGRTGRGGRTRLRGSDRRSGTREH